MRYFKFAFFHKVFELNYSTWKRRRCMANAPSDKCHNFCLILKMGKWQLKLAKERKLFLQTNMDISLLIATFPEQI